MTFPPLQATNLIITLGMHR